MAVNVERSILYRGSRDELNEMCRVKDERIAELEAALIDLYKWSGGTADTADGGWLNEAFNRHAHTVCQMPRFQRADK